MKWDKTASTNLRQCQTIWRRQKIQITEGKETRARSHLNNVKKNARESLALSGRVRGEDFVFWSSSVFWTINWDLGQSIHGGRGRTVSEGGELALTLRVPFLRTSGWACHRSHSLQQWPRIQRRRWVHLCPCRPQWRSCPRSVEAGYPSGWCPP